MPPTRSNSRLLQRAQELDLHLDRDLADLVEEQRAAVGELEAARLGADRAGEGALLVAEQLGLHQRLGDGGAVDLDERPVLRGELLVQRLGDQLLAGARLAGDEHRRRRVGDLLDDRVDLRASRGESPTRPKRPAAPRVLGPRARGARRCASALLAAPWRRSAGSAPARTASRCSRRRRA